MRIAARQSDKIARFKKLWIEIPLEVNLDSADWRGSIPRNDEPMWKQIVRNIKSHSDTEGNYIKIGYLEHIPRIGYKITALGLEKISKSSL